MANENWNKALGSVINNVSQFDNINTTTQSTCSISADDIFSSKIKGWDNATNCYFWKRMEVSADRRDNITTCAPGPIVPYNVIVEVPVAGGHGAALQTYERQGTIIKSIKISLYDNLAQTLVPTQTTEYEQCKVRSYEQDGNRIRFTFSFTIATDTFFIYDPSTSKIQGQKVARIDFEQWSAT